MQKMLTWVALIIKAQMCKKSTWIFAIVMIVLFALLEGISIPSADNQRVLVYSEDAGEHGQEVVVALENADSSFTFEQAEDKEQLFQEVYSGKAFCGFVLSEDFSRRLRKGEQEGIITYVCTGSNARGNIAQETVYANLFLVYSNCILEENADELVEQSEDIEDFQKDVKKRNREYLDSDLLFRIEAVRSGADTSADWTENPERNYPVPGMIALCIFVSMLLTRGDNIEEGRRQLYAAMLPGEKLQFSFLQYVVAGMMAGVFGFLYFLVGKDEKSFFSNAVVLMIYILFGALWMLLAERVFRKEDTYYAWVTTLVLASVILSPVFFNLATYIPVIEVVRYIFPVGFYINLYDVIH